MSEGTTTQSFWSLPIGARFNDGVTMWSFVKIGRFTAQYFDLTTTVFLAPWIHVKRMEDSNNESLTPP